MTYKPLRVQLNSKKFRMQSVDIIVPFYNKESTLVAKLIESIFNTVLSNRYLISLVDDGSNQKEFLRHFQSGAKSIPGISCISHETHKGFGPSIQSALERTKQPWILIARPGLVVEGSHWLANLGETLLQLKDSGVKMVSPYTDHPSIFEETLKFDKENVMNAETKLVPDNEYLPLYCALASRELFRRVGIPNEPQQFAQKMRSQGYKQAVCGSSWVHFEN